MEEIYLTPLELADLMNRSERTVQRKILEGTIIADVIELKQQGPGRGGIQYRIPLSGLDSKLQSRFKRRLTAAKKAAEKNSGLINEQPDINYEELTEAERQEIAKWKKIINEWQQFRALKKCKVEADEAFIEMAQISYPDIKINRRILYRKDKAMRENGDTALIDGRGKHKAHAKKLTDEMWDIFEYYYLDQSRKTVKLCMTLTELNLKQLGREDLLPLPSVTTFQRAVSSIPIPYIKYFRFSEKQFIGDCAPYIKRMYDDLESNDIWVADNHTFDVMVNKNNAPVRVYLTAFMDVRSRKMTGWCVTDAPSSDATIYALKRGCEKYGIPKALYTDNGREFLFHDLGGNGFRKKRKTGEPLKLPSILDDLGIEFRTALPRNARAKGIERAFCTVKETFSKLYEGYTGGTILEKPDRLKTAVKDMKSLAAIDEFKKQVDTYITGYYNKHTHNGEGMNGKSPDEVFAENLIEQRVLPKDKADLMFMRYAKSNTGTLKVGKNGISLKFYGQELQYWNEELWRLYFGRDVYVRYSPDDLSSIRVYDSQKRFICTADMRNAVGYRADKETIKELTREKRSAVKAVSAYKKNKAIEAKEALELIINEAARNSETPEFLNPNIVSPIFNNETSELPKASGGDNTVIDLAVMTERLRRAKEE